MIDGFILPLHLQPRITSGANTLAQRLQQIGWLMGTAESCTGGGIAFALTSLPGSSRWFVGGIVSYTNKLKAGLLAVPPEDIASHGAVSETVVAAMSAGALQALGCQISVAVSGIAGPAGAVPGKPVGTVCFGWAIDRGGCLPDVGCETLCFEGDRAEVRGLTILHAIEGCLARLP
jgi:nicotinamide-nucleotide amidase